MHIIKPVFLTFARCYLLCITTHITCSFDLFQPVLLANYHRKERKVAWCWRREDSTRRSLCHSLASQGHSQSFPVIILVPRHRTGSQKKKTHAPVSSRDFFSRPLQKKLKTKKKPVLCWHLPKFKAPRRGHFVLVDMTEAKLGPVQNKQVSVFLVLFWPVHLLYGFIVPEAFLHIVCMNKCSYEFLLLLYKVELIVIYI